MIFLERVIVARVRTELEHKNLTIGQLARKASIRAKRMKELLGGGGTADWRVRELHQIAKVLKVPTWQMLLANPDDGMPPELRDLVEDYRVLCSKRRQIVDDALAAGRAQRRKHCPEFRKSRMEEAYDIAFRLWLEKNNRIVKTRRS